MRSRASEFVEPPWGAVIPVEATLAAIPDDSTIAGMFYLALLDGAKRRNIELSLPKQRYQAFGFYSAKDFARALVQACRLFYPDRSLRQALRAIGMVGPKAFAESTLGKVTLGSAPDVHTAVSAIAKTYAVNIRPSQCAVLESKPRSMILSLENVHYFLDSHHVGVFEGTLEHVGVRGRVRIASRSSSAADLLIEW
ncbi:MAG: DUF2378 family protein [Myxococcota bacterium]